MPTPITGLRASPYFPTLLTTPIPLGGGAHLLGVLYSTLSGSGENPVAVACVLDKDQHLTEIGGSDPTRKDAGLAVWREGTDVFMIVNEASVPAGAGNTTAMYLYTFPDAVPSAVDPVAFAAYNRNGALMKALTTENQRLAPLVGGG